MNEELDRKINSIGKKCFVDNYHEFRLVINKKILAQKLLDKNPKATSLQAQLTRINCAIWIFSNKLEKEALKKIISSNIDISTRKKAESYLK